MAFAIRAVSESSPALAPPLRAEAQRESWAGNREGVARHGHRADAFERGRTLLVLNTRTGDPPEDLYRRLGYALVGHVPEFARNPDGTFNTTSLMYKRLDD